MDCLLIILVSVGEAHKVSLRMVLLHLLIHPKAVQPAYPVLIYRQNSWQNYGKFILDYSDSVHDCNNFWRRRTKGLDQQAVDGQMGLHMLARGLARLRHHSRSARFAHFDRRFSVLVNWKTDVSKKALCLRVSLIGRTVLKKPVRIKKILSFFVVTSTFLTTEITDNLLENWFCLCNMQIFHESSAKWLRTFTSKATSITSIPRFPRQIIRTVSSFQMNNVSTADWKGEKMIYWFKEDGDKLRYNATNDTGN